MINHVVFMSTQLDLCCSLQAYHPVKLSITKSNPIQTDIQIQSYHIQIIKRIRRQLTTLIHLVGNIGPFDEGHLTQTSVKHRGHIFATTQPFGMIRGTIESSRQREHADVLIVESRCVCAKF